MNDQIEATMSIAKACGDVARMRTCLRCRAEFPSEGFGERVCRKCKSSSTWRSAAPHSGGHGTKRSRSGGSS
ncbi:hypothetical protein N8I71_04170 [Roseibacterium sp. SDUM158016]|uniref:hypothetical protein n=1 Tax=Roseicyclus sediminis TaxID=2980997 RepID=UPI0021D3C257|nr:hypothetical protein [Roseibacterium sp. SDUM158016]MCU4652010.1 hypothetical protein [Roseibacterium sp. SDUM158016]